MKAGTSSNNDYKEKYMECVSIMEVIYQLSIYLIHIYQKPTIVHHE